MSKAPELRDLIHIGGPTPVEQQPTFGDHATLNSGGLIGIIVDIVGDDAVIAWDAAGKIVERTIPLVCLRRMTMPDSPPKC